MRISRGNSTPGFRASRVHRFTPGPVRGRACWVLEFPVSAYYGTKKRRRERSARQVRDEQMKKDPRPHRLGTNTQPPAHPGDLAPALALPPPDVQDVQDHLHCALAQLPRPLPLCWHDSASSQEFRASKITGTVQYRRLDRHVQRTGDLRALQRLSGAEFLPYSLQTWHLVPGESDLLAAELSHRQVSDLKIMILLHGGAHSFWHTLDRTEIVSGAGNVSKAM